MRSLGIIKIKTAQQMKWVGLGLTFGGGYLGYRLAKGSGAGSVGRFLGGFAGVCAGAMASGMIARHSAGVRVFI